MENKLIMSQKEECDSYNLITEIINKLVDMCDNAEAIILRDEFLELFTTKYSEPLYNVLGLQEQLGCSLEFIFKVLESPEIYLEGMNAFSEYTKEFKFHKVKNNYILNPDIFIYKNAQFIFVNRWSYGYDLRLKDYKITWWLREDRSE